MSTQDLAFYQILFPAITGILGVIIGVLITSIFKWKIKTKEVKLRIIERIFEKRIAAHEEILMVLKQLRITQFIYEADPENNALTYPAFLNDKESLYTLIFNVNTTVNHNSHWLNLEITRELNYLQDYLINLDAYVKSIQEKEVSLLGIKIKSDIIELAGVLEKMILKFFKKDIYKINLDFSEGHHKYPLEETKKRLNQTKLLQLIHNSTNQSIISNVL